MLSLPPDQVSVRIECCGLCSSDIDAMTKYAHMYQFPLVAGHEGIGEIIEKGALVKHLKVGQRVGIGVYRSSCGSCLFCTTGQNNLCALKELMFMEGKMGAFAEVVRIKAEFAIPIPDGIESIYAAPLMCAGVTTFAAYRRFNIQAGQRVGVLGIGGLGHLALQFGVKFGCEVIALSTSIDKQDYCKSINVHHFINIMNEHEIKPLFGSLDYLLVTASGDSLDYRALLGLLAPNGKLVLMGVSFKEQTISPAQLLVGQKSICGCAAGSTYVGDMFLCMR